MAEVTLRTTDVWALINIASGTFPRDPRLVERIARKVKAAEDEKRPAVRWESRRGKCLAGRDCTECKRASRGSV
jgi:hypothetical protein